MNTDEHLPDPHTGNGEDEANNQEDNVDKPLIAEHFGTHGPQKPLGKIAGDDSSAGGNGDRQARINKRKRWLTERGWKFTEPAPPSPRTHPEARPADHINATPADPENKESEVVTNAPDPTKIGTPRSQDSGSNTPLVKLEQILKKNFYKPDIQAIRIVLGTIQAHRLNLGDPAWLFVVAPPGSGKTTMSILGTSGLPDVLMLGDFSENTFLSGFYGHSQPGMLEKLGPAVQKGRTFTSTGDAVLMAKDFTTVLSMRREKRAAILGQLREIHDGQFRRDFGTGDTKIWRGRVTIIAAVTPVLDKYYSVFSALGERFMQLRWHRPDSEEAGVWAIQQQGKEQTFQADMRRVVGAALEAATDAPDLSSSMQLRIASLAEIIAVGRTHVYRSSFGNREIEHVPEPEANTRISKGLAAIAKGIASLNGHQKVAEEDIQDVFRVGLDSLQDYRRRLFLAVAAGSDLRSVNIPNTMRQRELEELEELQILERIKPGFSYKLSARVAKLWGAAKVTNVT
jgi:hypothetical protein